MRPLLVVASFSLLASPAGAGSPQWLFREFIDQWDVPGSSAESFLNEECRPGGLDGIQVFAVQKGHGGTFNLHIYCREDGSSDARYRITMPTVERGKIDSLVATLVGNPRLRIGPFHFGAEGEPDGILVIEKL